MHRSIAPAAFAAAAALTLAGCGGSAPAGNPSAPAETASSAAAPTPTAAKTYSNADLTSIVASLKDAQGQALTVVPAAQINQGMVAARELLETAVITPKACGVLADNNSQVPLGSTYAAGASLAAKAKTATVVTVFAVKDPAVMSTQFSKSAGAAGDCSTFTIELQGQKITTQTKPLDAAVQADKSVSVLTVQTLPTGQKQATATVTGVKGTLAATAVKIGAVETVTAASAAELATLVNTALADG
ncbi:MAG: hypothetical protein QOH40_1358 [Arthrobacter pascens]|nr:hypothetical protein [Arthrobacter pascens]